MVPTSAPVTRIFQQIPAPPAPALILVSESSFCDPGAFQAVASHLELRASEFAHKPF